MGRGLVFGHLTILEQLIGKRGNLILKFRCRCVCGKEKTISGDHLCGKGRTVKSCGCREHDKPVTDDLTGRNFGRWSVLGKTSKINYWKCRCDCGIEKEVFRGSLTHGMSMSCGCYDREKSKERMTGERNPSYNPLLTDKQREMWRNRNRGVYQSDLRRWRSVVFERDNYTCTVCGVKGGFLNAHHLDSWDWCNESRLDVDNGITSCLSCHRAFHIKYGRGKNTKEQFEEFKGACHALRKTA